MNTPYATMPNEKLRRSIVEIFRLKSIENCSSNACGDSKNSRNVGNKNSLLWVLLLMLGWEYAISVGIKNIMNRTERKTDNEICILLNFNIQYQSILLESCNIQEGLIQCTKTYKKIHQRKKTLKNFVNLKNLE